MAGDDDASIIAEIKDKYVPFLKKLISFLEKNKKATPDNLNRLKSIHTVFTSAPIAEQIEVFHANKKKLEKWFRNSQKDKMNEDGSTTPSSKRTLLVEDTDSSQGASENPSKKRKASDVTNNSTPTTFDPKVVAEIKKEKVDKPKVVSRPTPPPVVTKPSAPAPVQPPPAPAAPANPPNNTNEADDGQIIFTCASCQFQTFDEQEFMKHTRTDHRSDLSMWCKHCGKCFSNAGVLVSHIKEKACTKEEMIYKCGVKECTFETTSGQTFVHHLRHCHKGSPFIFCVHCQKIFTLPHCLILHMQDDCPYKEKNRRNPGSEPLAKDSAPAPAPKTPAPSPVVRAPAPSFTPRTPTISSVVSAVPRPTVPTPRVTTPTTRGRGAILPTSRGRGRGRGRGRARPPSESSESDDPDDPSWRPEETTGQLTLRRSGRWAKKVNDVINVEPKQSSKLSMAELNDKEMLKCPCCDFLAAFKSVLQDHYIANHKVPNKNACLVCHLKFEATQGFLDHFADHASGKLQNKEIDVSEKSNEITDVIDEPAAKEPEKPPEAPKTVSSSAPPAVSTISKEAEPTNDKIMLDQEMFNCVLRNLSDVEVIDPTSDPTKCVKIPYQAAIHDKNTKDSKIKKFEDLKSPGDLVALKNAEKLKCFYKCVVYNCSFTTDNNATYVNHLESKHKGKRLFCGYCLKEFNEAEPMTKHMIFEHSKRRYQCNNCFYRACSKMHVQVHIKNYHPKDTSSKVYTCEPTGESKTDDECVSTDIAKTAWPFICAIGDCSFQSFDPKEFKSHNEQLHRSVTMFFCHYCKVDFISFKRLLNHYRLHGVNTFQCNYCIHGSETKEEVLLHLCNGHPDHPLRALMRGSVEDATLEGRFLPSMIHTETNQMNSKVNSAEPARPNSPPVENANKIDFESQLYEVVGETYYPRYLQTICSDFICGLPWCQEKFENMLLYIGHLRNSHQSMNFSCPHCPSISESWDDFTNHLMCHGPDLFACGLVTCNFYDWDKTVVSNHLKEHSQSSAKVVIVREADPEKDEECDVDKVRSLPASCPFKVGEEFFQCFFCRYKSADRGVMKNHMYMEMRYMRFSCSYCGKKCVSRKEIKDHCLERHSEEEIKFGVDLHPEIESLVKKLLHQKIKSPDPKLIQCPICKKPFKSAIQWQRHMCLCAQNQYQPYDCRHCNLSVSDLRILKFHSDEKHYPKPMLYSAVTSIAVQEEIDKKLQEVRLAYLNKILYKDKSSTELQKLCFDKFYLCSACSYESNHKYNTQQHVKNVHRDSSVEVSKILRNVATLSLIANADEASNDSAKAPEVSASSVKRYRCGFCIKKLHTLTELEAHVEGVHPVRDESKYFYYYSPDPKANFPADDKELYECSYCTSGKENLNALKTHSDLMHSESPFKVRGYVLRNREKSSVIACGYCYQRLNGTYDLKRHSAAEHPSQPQKSICGFQGGTKKRELSDASDIPNKRVKFGSVVFVCSHCGAAFSQLEEMATHSRKTHSRLKLEYIQKNPTEESDDCLFYKCEFCKFTSEKEYLEPHLNAKHKMRVSCGHCNKRFEFATMLKKHHDVLHKDLPLKYSQETVGGFSIKKEEKHIVPSDDSNYIEDSPVSKIPVSGYKRRPDPIDLSRIYVYADSLDDTPTRMSVLTYSKICNIFPKVRVAKLKNLT